MSQINIVERFSLGLGQHQDPDIFEYTATRYLLVDIGGSAIGSDQIVGRAADPFIHALDERFFLGCIGCGAAEKQGY